MKTPSSLPQGKKLNLPNKFIAIDEEGIALLAESKVKDPALGFAILAQMRLAENGAWQTKLHAEDVLVEAFDEPYVAQKILLKNSKFFLSLPYSFTVGFDPQTLRVDEWDRFHGVAENGVAFVLSKLAQAEFFALLSEYDDESITLQGQKIFVPQLFQADTAVHSERYWSKIYQTEIPGWELNQASPILVDMLPRMKIPPSRVIVLGCGSANDAAFFAQHGHFVTAVDISPDAIAQAKAKYGQVKNLQFLQADLFHLPQEMHHSFDLVFEHTCFCAVDPNKRSDLIKIWKQLLHPEGALLAIFFVMQNKLGPPYGASEWELRERLKKAFQFVFWSRWQKSLERRNGKELLVYAIKRK